MKISKKERLLRSRNIDLYVTKGGSYHRCRVGFLLFHRHPKDPPQLHHLQRPLHDAKVRDKNKMEREHERKGERKNKMEREHERKDENDWEECSDDENDDDDDDDEAPELT